MPRKTVPLVAEVKLVRTGENVELIDLRDDKCALRTLASFVPFTDDAQVLAYLYCSLEHAAGMYEHRPMT